MKISVIVVLFETPLGEKNRLKREFSEAMIDHEVTLHFIDNTKTGKGYAEGVNLGILEAEKIGYEILFVANPDISFEGVNPDKFLDAAGEFDIWGYAMEQGDYTYYGGVLDPWRLSSILKTTKPDTRFSQVSYVTGSLIGMHKQVVDTVGKWDETYFMYYEDVDYCTRAEKKGFSIGIDSSISYRHFELSTLNSQKKKWIRSAWIKYFIKYSTFPQKLRELLRLPKTISEIRNEK